MVLFANRDVFALEPISFLKASIFSEFDFINVNGLSFIIDSGSTPENIENASLAELLKAFKVLKNVGLKIRPECFKIKGLVGCLVEADKKEKYLQTYNNDGYNIQ